MAAPVLTGLVGGISFGPVVVAVTAVAASLAGTYVVFRSVQILLRWIEGCYDPNPGGGGAFANEGKREFKRYVGGSAGSQATARLRGFLDGHPDRQAYVQRLVDRRSSRY